MTESLTSMSQKAGLPPGSLVHVGEVLEPETWLSIIDYSQETLKERVVDSVEQLLPYKETDTVTWVNVEGLKNINLIRDIGQLFEIHSLVLEDILNTNQRPKIEDHDDYLYIVLNKLLLKDDGFSVCNEQISILVLKGFVFTFKERRDDSLLPIKQRIQKQKGPLRKLGVDRLLHAIIDKIVDEYFAIQDSLDEVIDSIEDNLLANLSTGELKAIQQVRHGLTSMRKSISPLRDMLRVIQHSEFSLIANETKVYFRDIYDHVIHLSETIETHKDIVSNLLDIYILGVSSKTNEVTKVLTIFASIFIPLTFIVGIYGMNFEYMPELKWKWAYPLLWVLLITIPTALIIYFKKKKWL